MKDRLRGTNRAGSAEPYGPSLRPARFLVALLLGALLAASSVVAVELPFGKQVIEGDFETARTVFAADIDGDGDLDALVAGSNGLADFSEVRWFENTAGDGSTWTSRLVADSLEGLTSASAVDMDGDGDLDVLAPSLTSAETAWWENTTGMGTTWSKHTVDDDLRASSVHAADLDGDGDLDVVGAGTFDELIVWWENTAGDGTTWTEHVVNATIEGVREVDAADVDGDGDLDILSAADVDDDITWWENTAGDATTWTEHVIDGSFNTASSVEAVDLDGDGDLDVAGTARFGDRVSWWENTAGNGTAWTEHTVDASADGVETVIAADLDGDGDADLVGTVVTERAITWWENVAGDGDTWVERIVEGSLTSPAGVAVADLDRDGDLDVLATARIPDDVLWYENETIHRSAVHPVETNLDTTRRWRDVTSADLDGDGDVDIVAAASGATVWLENAAGDGSMWDQRTVVGETTNGVAVADMDGDGDLDVLTAIADDDEFAWWENTIGDGSAWTRRVVDGSFDGARAVAAADVDGDGDVDVVGSGPENDEVAWWENTAGDGSVWTKTTIDAFFDSANTVHVTDLDGDGDMDVLGSAAFADEIAWWENTAGDGSAWTDRTIDGSFDSANGVYAADLDGDGDLDVVGTAFGDDDVTWWENTASDGTVWTEHTIDASFDGAKSAFATDMDGDGDVDVLAAAQTARDITWWENAGTGTSWTEHTVAGNFAIANSAHAADLDGDGDFDILGASVSLSNGRLAWWENRGGQFALPTNDIAPARVANGAVAAVLEIEAIHRGRTGDQAVEVATLELLLEDGTGTPLTDLEIIDLVNDLRIYRDDGSGAFEPATDTEVATSFSTTAGVVTVSFTDNDADVTVAFGTPETYFVALVFQAAASAAEQDEIRVVHLTESSSTGEDADHDIPISLEFATDTASGVVDVNDAPVAVADMVMLLEDGGTVAGNVLDGTAGGLDTDEENDALTAMIISGPSNGALVGGLAPNGDFTYQPVSDFNGGDSFTYAANDGFESGNTVTVTIAVTPVNDVPSFDVTAMHSSTEDAGAQTVSGFASSISAGPSDESGQGVTFNVVDNSDPSLFSVAPAVSLDGTLTYTASPDANGTATIMVTLMDDGGTSNGGVDTSAAQGFDIAIGAVNDVPSFAVTAMHSSTEDAGAQTVPGFASSISAGPSDESGQGVTFNVVGNSDPSLFSVAPAVSSDGTLTYTASPDANGTATIMVTLMDDGGTSNGGVDTSAAQGFDIAIGAVNDVPSFDVSASHDSNEDAVAQTVPGFASSISAGPSDESGQGVTFDVVGNSDPSLFSIAPTVSSDGTLTYTAAADANGTATIMIELMDDGGTTSGGVDTSAAQGFEIAVVAVNDVPSFDVPPSVTVDQDLGPQSIAGFASSISAGPSDESGQALTFNITGNSNPTLFSAAPVLAPDGTLTFTSAPQAVGTATITVELMDDGGTSNGGVDTSATQDFEIEIADAISPEVVALAAAPGGVLEDCAELDTPTGALVVTFTEPMADPAGDSDPEDVTNPLNYQLIGSGPDNDLSTLGCDGLGLDDVLVPVDGVTFDGMTNEATVAFPSSLADGIYRLLVCDRLEDPTGNPLEDEVVVTFRQSATNVFRNGQVDCDLRDWVTVSTVPEEIAWSFEDVDNAVVSGSIHITNLSGTQFSVGQCVDTSTSSFEVETLLRLDGAADVLVGLTTTCEHFDTAGCTGTSLGQGSSLALFEETAGLWLPVTSVAGVEGAASALCSFDLSLLGGTMFDAYLDQLVLPGVVFQDGFESGDTSAWTATVP